MSINKPVDVLNKVIQIGESKIALTNKDIPRVLVLSILAGVYIAIGCTLSLIIGYGFPEVTANNPAMGKLLSGLVFPLGLIFVVMLGAELFTGNLALLMPSYSHRRHSFGEVLKNWGLVYVGNFIGSILFAYLFVYITQLTANEPYHQAAISVATAKVSMPWIIAFLKGVAANWFVCLAIWLALTCESAGARMFGCWFPIFAFVALGFEHSIANMFFIPLGIFEGANVTWGAFVLNNLIPVTLGNMLSGVLFVGVTYYYLHSDKIEE